MKAQSPFISHTIIIGITVFVIIVMLFALNYFKEEYQVFEGENEMKNVCLLLKNGIEKIYHPENAGYLNTSSQMGMIVLDLPLRIADMKYNIRFVNATIEVKSTKINQTCNLWKNATYIGSSSGGLTEISWIRLGQNDIIQMRNV